MALAAARFARQPSSRDRNSRSRCWKQYAEAISFLRQKQILHKLGVVISITVIGIACYVLYHMLRGIDTARGHRGHQGTTEPRQIALAALFVAAGYFTLTFYDLVRGPLRSAAPMFPTASTRSPPSPAIRSGTMSAPASSPAARCAIASIPRGD